MPKPPHELMHHVFRDDTGLLSRTLSLMEIPFPSATDVSVGNCDVSEIWSLDRRIDTLLEAETDAGPYLIVIEAQNKPEEDKLRNWAYYPTYLHERRRCPVVVIVVCRNKKTAEWAREPYKIGLPTHPSITSTPIVLGPDNLPAITDKDAVLSDLSLAVLSALAHAFEPEIGSILEAIAAAIAELDDPKQSENLMESIERGLQDTPAHETWKKKVAMFPVTLERRSKFALENEARGLAKGEAQGLAKGEAQGLAKGRAEDVLRLLDRRGITVTDELRERIAACADLDLLGIWFDEAITATSAADLTTPDNPPTPNDQP